MNSQQHRKLSTKTKQKKITTGTKLEDGAI